ncbi:hypothetical protein NM208_g9045 [Fusarium decemcellulare]|uniref:Uncharacterized protein n=1 Tax=Fusarium decemcellulare TaxID=57161 RepID=A0ACC1S308_9HYPO|nr:hypothetical protein NM208_g9045 [Fusarium decemcellulare]
MDVHRRLLDFAFRDADGADLLDYRYCTGAQIITEYKPKGAPSKTVDFCVVIKPPEQSTEAATIDSLTGTRPGLSINQTDWGNFNKHPIALSIETKRQSEWEKALLQIGTWHSAQWRALDCSDEGESIQCLPGIIVQGHAWYFVASTLEDGRSKLYHKLDIGGTDSHFGVYKLAMALQCLASWIEHTYWPAFKAQVLGQT